MIVIGSCVAAFCMFIFILRDQQDRFVAQQEENARQKASIMVLEMWPYFIYNTLTSIYSLCNQDPNHVRWEFEHITGEEGGTVVTSLTFWNIPLRDD